MKKQLLCILAFLSALSLCSCSPAAQEQAITVELSTVESLPQDTQGSLLCTVSYEPKEDLTVNVRNDTEFTLSSARGGGLLYRQADMGAWNIMDMTGPITDELFVEYTEPEDEISMYAKGYRYLDLEPGDYKLVFPVSLEGDTAEGPLEFDLVVPFSVA